MLPHVSNGTLGGGVQLAAFVQQQQGQGGGYQQQGSLRSSVVLIARTGSARRSAAAACGLLVMASAYCPPRPRSGRLQVCASKSKTRRRRSGSGEGDEDGLGSDWPFDAWSSLYYYGGGGNDSGSGGSGGPWEPSAGSPGGDGFHQAMYHGMFVWQLLCAVSLLHSLYFLLGTEAGPVQVAAAAAELQHVALAC